MFSIVSILLFCDFAFTISLFLLSVVLHFFPQFAKWIDLNYGIKFLFYSYFMAMPTFKMSIKGGFHDEACQKLMLGVWCMSELVENTQVTFNITYFGMHIFMGRYIQPWQYKNNYNFFSCKKNTIPNMYNQPFCQIFFYFLNSVPRFYRKKIFMGKTRYT